MKWFTKEEAIEHYNTTLYKIEKARKSIEPEDKNKFTKRDSEARLLISEEYLDDFFEWHRLTETYQKRGLTIRLNDFHWWLCKHKWSKERQQRITRKKYTTFIVEFFKLIAAKIIKENFIFILPYKLGSIFVKKIPRGHKKSKSINKSYKDKTGKSVAYSNKHTFGNRFVLKYDRVLTQYPNSGITFVRPAQYFKKELYKEIMRRVEKGQKSYNAH